MLKDNRRWVWREVSHTPHVRKSLLKWRSGRGKLCVSEIILTQVEAARKGEVVSGEANAGFHAFIWCQNSTLKHFYIELLKKGFIWGCRKGQVKATHGLVMSTFFGLFHCVCLCANEHRPCQSYFMKSSVLHADFQIVLIVFSSLARRAYTPLLQFCTSSSDSHCTRGSESTQGPRSFIMLPVSSQYTQPESSHRVVLRCSACQLSTCPGQGWSGRGLQRDA